jgi:hypothetical protein
MVTTLSIRRERSGLPTILHFHSPGSMPGSIGPAEGADREHSKHVVNIDALFLALVECLRL